MYVSHWLDLKWVSKEGPLNIRGLVSDTKKQQQQQHNNFPSVVRLIHSCTLEPRHEKTYLRGLRPVKTQTSLLSYRDQLETCNFGYSK